MQKILTKTCTKCLIEKSILEFYKRKDSKSGFRSHCKVCTDIDNNKYELEHPEQILAYGRKCDKKHRKTRNKKIRDARKNFPWYRTYFGIVKRCTDPKASGYKYYGGKGVKNFLTLKDLEYLWFRDKAYEMKRPSIERKDPSKHYTLKNCEYIEYSENVKRARSYCYHCKGLCKLRESVSE